MHKTFSRSETIFLPVEGQLKDISSVNDEVFSSKAVGDGFAVIPSSDELYAPVTGKITSVFPTQHAITLISDNGVEILMHIGIDTVELKGRFFNIEVKKGEHVEQGDLLGTVNFKKIKDANYDPIVMLIVTNLKDTINIRHISDKLNKQSALDVEIKH